MAWRYRSIADPDGTRSLTPARLRRFRARIGPGGPRVAAGKRSRSSPRCDPSSRRDRKLIPASGASVTASSHAPASGDRRAPLRELTSNCSDRGAAPSASDTGSLVGGLLGACWSVPVDPAAAAPSHRADLRRIHPPGIAEPADLDWCSPAGRLPASTPVRLPRDRADGAELDRAGVRRRLAGDGFSRRHRPGGWPWPTRRSPRSVARLQRGSRVGQCRPFWRCASSSRRSGRYGPRSPPRTRRPPP